jgi:acyl carrier protein
MPKDSLTVTEIMEFVGDILNVPAEELLSEFDTAHPEWDSLDLMALLAALSKRDIIVDPREIDAIRSPAGIVGLFRAAGQMVETE